MNNEQYQQLNDKDKAIASECYLDGFNAAIELVESITMKVEGSLDEQFDINKKSIVHLMKSSYIKMKES